MTSHSKENALSEREFERIMMNIEQIDSNWYRNCTKFVITLAGRLGMRAGEIAHITEDWVDFKNGMIEIPNNENCTKSKDDCSCGYCRSLAKSVVKHGTPSIEEAKLSLLSEGLLVETGYPYQQMKSHYKSFCSGYIEKSELENKLNDIYSIMDDRGIDASSKKKKLNTRAEKYVEKHDVDLEEALDKYWIPKTEASARKIPFDFSTRNEIIIEDFFNVVDRYPNSRTTVNRRVDDALEISNFDKSKTNPHGLRATAASFHAGRGLSTLSLQAMFGWKQIDTAMKYISRSGINTQRELNSIH